MAVDDALLAEIAGRLTVAAPGCEIILFGSQARGDAGPRSDVDLLVIPAVPVANTAVESVRLRRELRGLGVPIDVIVMNRSTVAEWRDVVGALANAAVTEGRRLVA